VNAPNTLSVPRKKGRPLSFDRAVALQKAMLLFWEHGYEATSLNDLTSALGVPPSSIYTAFGDKKGLFFDAVGLYLSGPVTLESMLDEAPTAHAAVEAMLTGSAIGFTGENTPAGCLLAYIGRAQLFGQRGRCTPDAGGNSSRHGSATAHAHRERDRIGGTAGRYRRGCVGWIDDGRHPGHVDAGARWRAA
jgi:AcrR family transcriptional regulator